MSRLTKNIIYNFMGQGLLLLLGFVSVKYIFTTLGEDALGIIYFTTFLNGLICAAFQLGVCNTLVREVSARLDTEPAYITDLVRTGSLFFWGAFAVLAVAVYSLAPLLVESWINLGSMDSETAVHVLRVLGIAALAGLPRAFYSSLFSGLQRMEFNNIINVATTALQQLGAILILAYGGSIFVVVYWYASCYALRIASYVALTARFFTPRSLVPGFSTDVIKRNKDFASKMAAFTALASVLSQADKLLLSKFLPIAALGFYTVAYNTVSKGSIAVRSISEAAMPAFSELFGSGDLSDLMARYRKLQDLVCYVTAPLFATVPFMAMPLFSYLFNAETAETLFLPSILLALGFYMNGTMHVPHMFTLAAGRPDIPARFAFYCLFTYLPAAFVLVYSFGLVGAAALSVLGNLLAYSYSVPRMCRECLHIPPSRWFRHTARVYFLAFVAYAPAWAVLKLSGASSVPSLVAAYASATLLFAAGSYFMVGEELKKTISGHVRTLKVKAHEAA